MYHQYYIHTFIHTHKFIHSNIQTFILHTCAHTPVHVYDSRYIIFKHSDRHSVIQTEHQTGIKPVFAKAPTHTFLHQRRHSRFDLFQLFPFQCILAPNKQLHKRTNQWQTKRQPIHPVHLSHTGRHRPPVTSHFEKGRVVFSAFCGGEK